MPRGKGNRTVNDSPTAALITKILNSSKKTQLQIADEMGLPKANALSMMKQGRIKMPLTRIFAFAQATNSDPGLLLDLALEESYPEVRNALAQCKKVTISEDEGRLLRIVRKAKKEWEAEHGPAEFNFDSREVMDKFHGACLRIFKEMKD